MEYPGKNDLDLEFEDDNDPEEPRLRVGGVAGEMGIKANLSQSCG